MEKSEKRDEEIASSVQAGNTDLFGELVYRYEKKIARYAAKILYNQDDIQDVVQDIFTKAYVNINSFDSSRKFSSWLYRIAHNEIVNVFKKNKRINFLPTFDLDSFLLHRLNSRNDIHEELDKKEIRALVDTSLDLIDERYREPIILYYMEDFSYKEIADIMHIPISTVGIRIKRAKKVIKNILEKQNYDK